MHAESRYSKKPREAKVLSPGLIQNIPWTISHIRPIKKVETATGETKGNRFQCKAIRMHNESKPSRLFQCPFLSGLQ